MSFQLTLDMFFIQYIVIEPFCVWSYCDCILFLWCMLIKYFLHVWIKILSQNMQVITRGQHMYIITVTHYIDTGDTCPMSIWPQHIALCRNQIIEEGVTKMSQARVIHASNSPWNVPVVLVRKKDGCVKFCIYYYRKLTNVTWKNLYPLPQIKNNLKALLVKSWFCTPNLASSYCQIKMHEGDIK